MLILILKTLMRTLLVFFPVVYLSFGQSNHIDYAGVGLIVLLIFVITLILAVWARREIASKNTQTRNMTGVESVGGQNR